MKGSTRSQGSVCDSQASRTVDKAKAALSHRAGTITRMISPDVTFIVGGARSGKSAHAEQLASDSARPVTYIATARVADDEFAARVELHRVRRPAHWRIVEAPLDLPGAIAAADAPGHCLLVDCLTLWLVNLLCPADGEAPAADYQQRFDALDAALAAAQAKVIVVSNEIGLGVVPLGAATRLYVDELGRLNQRIAARAANVTMMVAGLPLALKTAAPEPSGSDLAARKTAADAAAPNEASPHAKGH
jgi:adenosylcobinamide kinase/adenosylcobinamide-phosphate guanylyltransferase